MDFLILRWEMTQSLNHCQKFQVEKAWFSKYMLSFFKNIDDLLCYFILVNAGDFSRTDIWKIRC